MKYRALLELSIEHAYYGGACPDFVVEPTAETVRVLKNHRAVLKETRAGIEILVPVDQAGAPFIELGEQAEFVFSLRLIGAGFPSYTELSPLEGLVAPIFSNAMPGRDSHELVPVARERFPKLPNGAFALVEILHRSQPGMLPADPARYLIRFAAKSAHWSYYCVTDLPIQTGDLTIVDLGNEAPERRLLFGPANRTDLGSSPDTADRIATELAQRYPEKRRVRFVSDETVPCSAAPRKRLELQLNGQRLTGPLPNPPWLDFTVLPAAPSERPTFYHVVKHVTRKNGG